MATQTSPFATGLGAAAQTVGSAAPADAAEMLLAYQGVVVHDLRGDLNGLLLTVDFLKRQLGNRPEVASLFADTMGDLDHVRESLTRTLNQLEMVGHARRIVGGRDSPERAELSLSATLADVARHQLADRARRRQVNLRLPTDGGVTVTADAVLLQLAMQRLLNAFVDLGKKTDLNVTTEQVGDDRVRLYISLADPAQTPPELLERGAAAVPGQPTPGPVMAVGLAAKLAVLLGGTLRKAEPEKGGGLCLELPIDAAGGDGGPGGATPA